MTRFKTPVSDGFKLTIKISKEIILTMCVNKNTFQVK